ncbi:MAG: AraC family transcriptional regulator [Clostridiaceae bacterium]|nr:AraC family transcriptional regulator [Clostridiaceae bacterium]
MKSAKQNFTQRQHMLNSTFEFFHYRDDSNLVVEYHHHDFYEIYFFVSGKVNYVIEGKSYSLKPGDILIINNKELHKPVIEGGSIYERYVLWVNPDLLVKYSTKDSNLLTCFESTSKNRNNLLRPRAEMNSILNGILTKLSKVCSGTTFGSEILMELYLIELIIYLNKEYIACEDDIVEDMVYDPKIGRIITYINENLGENLSLENLASQFYISKYHLLRMFKKHTGYTPYNYIHKKRLITAKSLLKEGLSISQVCHACGFNDYSNFIRIFGKEFGISPKKYATMSKNSPI